MSEKIVQLNEEVIKGQLQELVRGSVEETLTYCDFPYEHWTRIRTNNVIERLTSFSWSLQTNLRITFDSTANLSYDNEVKGIWNQITVKTVTKSPEGSASGSLFLECSEKLAKKFLRKKTFKEQRQMG